MIIKQKHFLLSMLAIFATTALHGMDQQDNQNNQEPAQNNAIKDDLLNAKKDFYKQKTQSNEAMQKLQEKMNGLSGHSQRAVITKTIDLAGTWTDRGITLAFNELRKRNNLLTEEEEIAQNINRELFIAKQKENILTESTTETKKAEDAFYKSQKLNSDIDAAMKLCHARPSTDIKCKELLDDLFKKLEELSKK